MKISAFKITNKSLSPWRDDGDIAWDNVEGIGVIDT